MMDDKEQRIKAKAYVLWEQEGRPDGEHDRHWKQAVESLESETGIVVESEGTTNAVKLPKVAKPKTLKSVDLAAASVAVPKPRKTKPAK